MPRDNTPELMDDPNVDADELDRSLVYIRAVNRRLGGVRALLGHLQRWSVNWPTDRPVTLIDLGTGSADLPVAARRWAMANGFDLRITAVDNHATTLDHARRYIEAELGSADPDTTGITLVNADARSLIDRFEPRSFDYAHAGMFLHHLPDIEVMTVLRIMQRLSRAGLIWNDLVRSPLAKLGVRLITLTSPEIVKHDARVSVDKAFTRREVLDFRSQLSLGHTRYRRSFLFQRFTLAGEQQGAWR